MQTALSSQVLLKDGEKMARPYNHRSYLPLVSSPLKNQISREEMYGECQKEKEEALPDPYRYIEEPPKLPSSPIPIKEQKHLNSVVETPCFGEDGTKKPDLRTRSRRRSSGSQNAQARQMTYSRSLSIRLISRTQPSKVALSYDTARVAPHGIEGDFGESRSTFYTIAKRGLRLLRLLPPYF